MTASSRSALFDEKRCTALGTWLRHGSIPCGKRTGRIVGATKKYFSFLRSFFADLPRAFLFRTLYAEVDGHGILAFRISGAAQKFSKPSLLHDHAFTAVTAYHVSGRGLSGASVFLVAIGDIHRILAGRVVGTGYKPAPLAPFYNHRALTLVAYNIRRRFFLLDISHMQLGILELFFKRGIEIIQCVKLLSLSLFDQIQFIFQRRRKFNVEYLRKIFHQQFCNERAQLCRDKPSFFQTYILSILDSAKNIRIGAGSADTVFFQFSHEGCFCESWRRLSKFLLRLQRNKVECFAHGNIGKGFAEIIVALSVFFAFRVDDRKSGEFHHRSLRAEEISARFRIDCSLIKYGGIHLACREAVPYQLVEAKF